MSFKYYGDLHSILFQKHVAIMWPNSASTCGCAIENTSAALLFRRELRSLSWHANSVWRQLPFIPSGGHQQRMSELKWHQQAALLKWGQLRNDCVMLCMSAECFCSKGLLSFFKSLVKCPRDVFYDQMSVRQLHFSALNTPSSCSADTFAHVSAWQDTAHYCPQVATMS